MLRVNIFNLLLIQQIKVNYGSINHSIFIVMLSEVSLVFLFKLQCSFILLWLRLHSMVKHRHIILLFSSKQSIMSLDFLLIALLDNSFSKGFIHAVDTSQRLVLFKQLLHEDSTLEVDLLGVSSLVGRLALVVGVVDIFEGSEGDIFDLEPFDLELACPFAWLIPQGGLFIADFTHHPGYSAELC
jgi:hypothetical protein